MIKCRVWFYKSMLGHFAVAYGNPAWPSFSYWIVPGTIDLDEI